MKASQILKIVSLIISLVAVYFFVQVSTNGDGVEGDVEALNSAVSGFIGFTKILLILTVVLVVVFMILDVVKYPGKLKKTITGLVAFAVLFVLAYVLADSGEVITSSEVIKAGSSLSKNVSTGILFSFILGALAFGGFVFDSVKSLLK